MSNERNFYYERFVNEDNIKAIPETKSRRQFWVNYFLFYVFSGVIPLIFTFVGFNFDNKFSVGMFSWNAFLLFWLIYFFIKFEIVCVKHKVFKKKYMSYLACAIPIILCVIFSIAPIRTTEFINNDDESFKVVFNPTFFLFIFLPLYFGYISLLLLCFFEVLW